MVHFFRENVYYFLNEVAENQLYARVLSHFVFNSIEDSQKKAKQRDSLFRRLIRYY